MTDDKPLNKRQQQAAETRERVLRAATEVFEERGYRSTTVGAITAAAETAHGTFYLYFKNKDDCLIQVVESVGDQLVASVTSARDDDPWQMCRGTLLAFLKVFEDHGGLWTTLLEGSFQSPTIYERWESSRRTYIDVVHAALEDRQLSGRANFADIDPKQAAVALASMAEWFAFTYLVLGSANDEGSTAEEAVDTVATLWYRAVFGRTDRD